LTLLLSAHSYLSAKIRAEMRFELKVVAEPFRFKHSMSNRLGQNRQDLGRSLALLLFGKPIHLRLERNLRAVKGKLQLGGIQGRELDGASFIRQREIVLADSLSQPEHRRVLLHELFHFVWVRLSNQQRRSYEELLRSEMDRGVIGELSWPSFQAKERLNKQDWSTRSKGWRGYACESFCDTCSWYWRGMPGEGESAFPKIERTVRKRWVENLSAAAIRV
jgi:hypothetical protein